MDKFTMMNKVRNQCGVLQRFIEGVTEGNHVAMERNNAVSEAPAGSLVFLEQKQLPLVHSHRKHGDHTKTDEESKH
jgi:hypothetical protein